MKIALVSILISLVSTYSFAFDHGHSEWASVLDKFVSQKGKTSVVDYKSLKENPKDLNAYLQTLSAVTKEEYEKFGEDQKLAFLINAYNAFTLKLIIDHYPVRSIEDIGSFFSSPWKKEFFEILGKRTHLDHIEHGMIRVDFKEPRIHFAVNCASVGCPSLLTEPFLAKTLDQQLEEAATNFLSDSSRNRYDSKSKTLYLSKIFDWYGGDFKAGGGVQKFAAKRMAKNPRQEQEIEKAKLKYLDYDWSLNAPAPND